MAAASTVLLAALISLGTSHPARSMPASDGGGNFLVADALNRFAETEAQLGACQTNAGCYGGGSGERIIALRNQQYQLWGELYFYANITNDKTLYQFANDVDDKPLPGHGDRRWQMRAWNEGADNVYILLKASHIPNVVHWEDGDDNQHHPTDFDLKTRGGWGLTEKGFHKAASDYQKAFGPPVSSLGGPVATEQIIITLAGVPNGSSSPDQSTITGGASMPFPHSTAGASSPPPASTNGTGSTTAMVSLGGGIFGKATYNPDGTMTVSNNLGTTTLTMAQVKQVASGDLSPLKALGANGLGNPNAAKMLPAASPSAVHVSSLGNSGVNSGTVHFTMPSNSAPSGNQSTITGLGNSSSSPLNANVKASPLGALSPASVSTSAPNVVTPAVHQQQVNVKVATPTSPASNVRTSTVSAPTAPIHTPTVTVHVPTPTVHVPTPTVHVPQVQVRIPQVQVRIPQVQPHVSDIRLKRDIAVVGELPSGLHLYRYRYLWSDTLYVGVMAQEVMAVDPDAVVRGNDGYLRVDYGRLGLRLTTWDRWLRQKAVSAAAVKEQ